ncbi:thiazole synthase [Saccharibacillus sp. CPCC 101409]|uniref:thiazole synthase n=1 Tax=Saccharibacillus sp. CPCC 101409 TaxID=3058041 RepID=UPI0026730AD2|nr:thiazole synthase [Saccharibacillus sp. CPCC 101409]MDO3409791.1 thiazole synthase [Saccharibacillus sp. CPCC 101409]
MSGQDRKSKEYGAGEAVKAFTENKRVRSGESASETASAGGGNAAAYAGDTWRIGGLELTSRFFLGTGLFPNPFVQTEAIRVSGAEVLTFAIRRVDLEAAEDDSILQHIEPGAFQFLPNTSGARTAEEAVRIARLARASGLSDWIKVEISADERTLLPDPIETLRATEILVEEGFTVLPYISDDPVICRRLEAAGAAAIMPGGAPIGTGLGILNPYHIGLIAEEAKVPVIVDAGLGTASDAALAMELGAAAVLMNTPVARAQDPVHMALAMKLAIEAGRLAYLSGRTPKKRYASASSGLESLIVE